MDYEAVFNIFLGMLALVGCGWSHTLDRLPRRKYDPRKKLGVNGEPLRVLIREIAARVPGVRANAIAQTEEM